MTPGEALDVVISRTGHVRYRDLCDPTHPAYHPAYVALVLRLAGHAPPDMPPAPVPVLPSGVGPSLDAIRRRELCPHYVPRRRFAESGIADCGCGLDHCRAGRGRQGGVTLADCAACPDLPGMCEESMRHSSIS